MAYTAMNIASEVVSQYQNKGTGITNLKLQKVLYYIQLESLATLGTPAFKDDIEAWKLGPVVRDIYNHFRKYIADPISEDDWSLKSERCEIEPAIKGIITKIVEKTQLMDPWDLVKKTHETTPWLNYYIENMSRVIPVDAMRHCAINL